MSDDTAIAVRKTDAPEVYGSREEIKAQADRFMAMLPNADKLKPNQRLALAQYSLLTGANPYRGELYAYEDNRGNTVLEEGYKLLVRWARSKCEYTDKYDALQVGQEGLREGDVGVRIWILRDDRKAFMREMVDLGAPWRDAFEMAATSAVGIVRKYETWSTKYNKPIDPPTGWSWEQVARKRALKNALNLAYGMPSVQEIARETWNINGTHTEPQDWEQLHGATVPELEAEAEYNAKRRQTAENPTVESAPEAVADLFGDDAAEEFVEGTVEPENGDEPPEEEHDDPPHLWSAEEAKDLTNWWRNTLVITDAKALEMLGVSRVRDFRGDFSAAQQVINAQLALEVNAAEEAGDVA